MEWQTQHLEFRGWLQIQFYDVHLNSISAEKYRLETKDDFSNPYPDFFFFFLFKEDLESFNQTEVTNHFAGKCEVCFKRGKNYFDNLALAV